MLITIHLDNLASKRVIESNAGQFTDQTTDPNTGTHYHRYWINLNPR